MKKALIISACLLAVLVFFMSSSDSPEECFKKAEDYEKGKGVEQNLKEACKWYLKAAKQGHVVAQRLIGVRYLYGGAGVEKDEEEGMKWIRKSAESGCAFAQWNMGLCYLNGQGVEKNSEEAIKWFQKAGKNGHSEAFMSVGDFYSEGMDHEEAVKWYRKAAERGCVVAQVRLGNCYLEGKGVGENLLEAAKWFQRAAEQGDSEGELLFKMVGALLAKEEMVRCKKSMRYKEDHD